MGGNDHRRNMSRSARSNVTYNEELLSEMARPLYYDWKGYAYRRQLSMSSTRADCS
jgi:hypothetical protein